MSIRMVVTNENGIKVLPCVEDLEKLEIKEVGRIYLAKDPDSGILYKLHACWVDKDTSGLKRNMQKLFIWIMMNNSVGYSSLGENETIGKAIIAANIKGWCVVQANYSDFENIVSMMMP